MIGGPSRERERRQTAPAGPVAGGGQAPPRGDGLGPARLSRTARSRPAAEPREVAPGSAATSAKAVVPDDHRHLLNLVRAADRLRVRELLGAALRRRRVSAPSGTRTLWLEDFELPEEVWALVPDPDRARVLHALERHRLRRGAVPEPGRRDRERAALRDLERGCAALNPVLRRPRAGRRGADRQPDGRPAAVSRSRRSTAATCWWGWSRRAGRASPAAPGWSEAIGRLLRRAALGGCAGMSRRDRDPRRRGRAGGARARVRGARRDRRGATPRSRRSTSTCT